MPQKAEKGRSKSSTATDKKKKAPAVKKAPATKKVAEKKTAEKKTAEKKAAPKRKSRARSAKVVRLKAFWGVFNQSLKRIALFEHNEKKEADKKAKELTASGKSPHFVQPVKEVVQE
jgi:hypothetical protein